MAYHITQRGVSRETFSSDEDRHTYLGLLQKWRSSPPINCSDKCFAKKIAAFRSLSEIDLA